MTQKPQTDAYGHLLVETNLIKHEHRPLMERLKADRKEMEAEKRMRKQVFRHKPNKQKQKVRECNRWLTDIQDALDYIQQLERELGHRVEQGTLNL